MNEPSCQINPAVGVRFENISVERQGKAILENVNAAAPAGSATVIVGPNGAGKTTLLRCLLGEARHGGKVEFFTPGGELCQKPTIGYVPQQLLIDAQAPLRVYEFMALGQARRPLWLGCSKACRSRSREYLALVDGSKLENCRLGSLSGGETRRVLLASALAKQPRLLVLDEAEAGVDFRGERLFWELLDRTRKELNFTLLMVSHNLPLAAHYATHVICIRQTMLAQGAPQQTLTSENLFKLFGAPIHLYPQQCENPDPACPKCGAYGTPHVEALLPPVA